MRRLLGFLTIAILSACGDDSGGTPDATTPDASATFGTPIPVTLTPGVGVDDDPSFTDDLLDLYFNRDGDVYMAHRATPTGAFDAPVKLAEVSGTGSYETGPQISGDGLTLIFASDRTGANLNIFVATRATRTAAFDAPTAVAELSSPVDDAGPSMTNDGLTAVVSSIRDGGNPDLFIATRASTSAAFGAPTAIAMANTPAGENSPQLTEDKLTLYWDANPVTSGDLFSATRTSATGTFGAPTAIAELNTTFEEGDLWVSRDAHHCIFVSNRTGTFSFYEATR